MKKLLPLLFAASVFAEDNQYQSISSRNAFDLMPDQPKPVLPPVSEILKPNLYLTGLTRLNGVRKAHLVLRRAGQPDKFLSLSLNNKQDGIELKKILNESALISNNGQDQLISFENNGLPTIITKAPEKKSSTDKSPPRSSRGRESSKKEDKKSAPAPAQPSVIKVPSRNRGITDPRMQKAMERGLEYLNKMEDGDRKDYLLKRIESLQSGQYQIKSDIAQNERRRQYDEWRKRRDSR